jgi:hypothetical protein
VPTKRKRKREKNSMREKEIVSKCRKKKTREIKGE